MSKIGSPTGGPTHSVVRSFINACMSIAIAGSTHLCLQGSRVPLSQTSRRPQWEDWAGLGLFKTYYYNSGSPKLPIPPIRTLSLSFP
jgi:hypothetical protein